MKEPRHETPEQKQARIEAEEQKELMRIALLDAKEKLMKLPEFKLYMRHLLSQGGLMSSVMTGNSWTHYKSGRQDFARQIWAELAAVDQAAAMNLMTIQTEKESNG